jgi:SAM-dependent methyltransferase
MLPFNPPPRDPRITELLSDYPAEWFTERFHRSVELVERYGLDLALDLVRRLDIAAHLRNWRSAAGLCRELGFQPRFQIALGWLLERLATAGHVAVKDSESKRRYRLRGELPMTDLAALRDIGLALDPANAPTLDLLDAAAAVYPSVAKGASGAETLFGMSQIQLWLAYFSNSNPLYAINNRLAAAAAAGCAAALPRLRILEIGAGGGSGTDALLQVLGERGLVPRIERYLITEPNPFFRRRGEREIDARHPDLPLEFGSLDMDQPWDQQGAPRGGFDLVYAVNAVHVAHDLLFTLEQARQTLAATGWLVLGECLRPFPGQPIYAELVFQILDSFTDVVTDPVIRPNPGFLTPEQWRCALTRAGFARLEIKPDPERMRDIYPGFYTGSIAGSPGSAEDRA